MNIRNYDSEIKSTEEKFKQLEDYMPSNVFACLYAARQEQEKRIP